MGKINSTGTAVYPYERKMNIYPYLIPHSKINSKCLVDLRVKAKTIKLEEIIIIFET